MGSIQPQFFFVDHLGYCPWGKSARAPEWRLLGHCRKCSRPIHGEIEGEAYVEIEGRSRWADAMGTAGGTPDLLVSERVVTALKGAGITCARAWPVVIERVWGPLKHKPGPAYSHLSVPGRMNIDLVASGVTGSLPCPECLRPTIETDNPRRYVPVASSWDGADLFRMRNWEIGRLCCTRKVLDLARKERWTNFRFIPMDAEGEYALGWRGVDYLGKKWPPDKWYPDRPSAGKTAEEWAAQLFCGDPRKEHFARRALMDLGDQVVGPLVEVLHSTDLAKRQRAANYLSYLREVRDMPLPPEVEVEVDEVHRGYIAGFLSEYGERAIPGFINILKAAPGPQRKYAALELLKARSLKYAQMLENNRDLLRKTLAEFGLPNAPP
jgi:hypothetical protein